MKYLKLKDTNQELKGLKLTKTESQEQMLQYDRKKTALDPLLADQITYTNKLRIEKEKLLQKAHIAGYKNHLKALILMLITQIKMMLIQMPVN